MKRTTHLFRQLLVGLIWFSFASLSGQTSNLIANGSFETWAVSTAVPDSWNGMNYNTVTTSYFQFSNDAHTGSNALLLKHTGSTGTSNHKRIASSEFSLVKNATYTVTFWLKGSGSIRVGYYDGTTVSYGATLNPTATWTEYTHSFTPSVSGSGVIAFSVFNAANPGTSVLVDDVTVSSNMAVQPSINPIDPLAYSVEVGQSQMQKIAIKGFDLSGDVLLSLKTTSSMLQLQSTVVPKSDALAGTEIGLTFSPTVSGSTTNTLLISPVGGNTLEVPIRLIARPSGLSSFNLTPTDDVYIYCTTDAASRDICQGTADIETLATYESGISNVENKRKTYLKFDLSAIQNPVEYVLLRVYGGDDRERHVAIFSCDGTTWAEDDITYNKRNLLGTINTTPIWAEKTLPGETRYYDFDITSAVLDALQAHKQFVSFEFRELTSVRVNGNMYVCNWHSKENVSGNAPHLTVAMQNVDELQLSDLKVNGSTLSDFSASSYRYFYKLPYGTTLPPTIEVATINSGLQLSVENATNLSGNELQRTSFVRISDGNKTLTYSVVFELLPPPTEARLAQLTINGKRVEFFDKDVYTYKRNLPYTFTGNVVVASECWDPQASATVTQVVNLNGGVAERTATVVTRSQDQSVSKSYTIEFEILPKLDLYIGLGQSNMSGRAEMTDHMEVVDNAYLLTPDGYMEAAQNPLNKYSNIRKDLSLQKLGPAYQFVKELTADGHKIGLIVNSQGGSSIVNWVKGKELYDMSISRIKQMQPYGEFKGVIWQQGSSDGSYVVAGTYLSRLVSMVTSLRQDLGLRPDQLYFVAGELPYWRGGGTGSDPYNAMIRTLPQNLPNSDYVSVEFTAPATASQYWLVDANDPHFNTAGQLELGKRFAQKTIQAVYQTTSIVAPEKEASPIARTFVQGLRLKIDLLVEEADYILYTSDGRALSEGRLNGSVELPLPTTGVYILTLRNSALTQTRKLISSQP